ncbi:MAG TPA: hypothetical protein VMV53_08525 [Acidimicrobiales bacterium]|nr:hypothetical protein [Acidimicrobiales bacterium]
MRKTNDTYCVILTGRRINERYYRDERGWLKVSSRGRVFRMSAEQVLNHLLAALALGDELGLAVTVEHTDTPYWQSLSDSTGSSTDGSSDGGTVPDHGAASKG